MAREVYLRRERFSDDSGGIFYKVRGEYTDEAEDVSIDMGPLGDCVAWWEVPLPSCPDCYRGELVWAEAGFVPGTRACKGCGSLFSVQTREGR